MEEIKKPTRQLQEVLVKFTGRSLVATAAHPQALEDAVRLALVLLLPFDHQGGADSGGEAGQREEEPEQLQSGVGHRVQMEA